MRTKNVQNVNCEVQKCSFRHPRKCRYYLDYNNCKFGNYCKFSHDVIPKKKHIEEIEKVEKQIVDLKKEIIEKDTELKKKEEEINIIEMKIMLEKERIIKLKDEKINSLTNENLEKQNKVEDLEKEIDKLKEENKALTLKGMFFDIFKIEMREKYGHVEEDTDEEEDIEGNDESVEEVEGRIEINQGFQCDQCKFIGKSDAGLKTHKTVKHRRKSGSCNL